MEVKLQKPVRLELQEHFSQFDGKDRSYLVKLDCLMTLDEIHQLAGYMQNMRNEALDDQD